MDLDEVKRQSLISKINAQPGMKLAMPLHDFDTVLKQHAIGLITAFGVFEYDDAANVIKESSKASEIRSELGPKYQLLPLWISFSTGIECLAKSVLIKHDALDAKNKNKTAKVLQDKASNYQAAIAPYGLIKMFVIDYNKEPLTAFERRCVRIGVTHLYNLQIGTLGGVIDSLGRLKKKNLIDEDQELCLANALQVLLDLRRNIDVHTFHQLVVGSGINGDLENLYLPAINLLLQL